MNPMTNMKNVVKLSERELTSNSKSSWHDEYKGSAWIFVGGLPYDLSEGDLTSVFSQYGEIANMNYVRDKETGKPKGFCFICYEDQRSTILAVDNFNGIKLLGRTLRVDHVKDYKPPKEKDDKNKRKRGDFNDRKDYRDNDEKRDWRNHDEKRDQKEPDEKRDRRDYDEKRNHRDYDEKRDRRDHDERRDRRDYDEKRNHRDSRRS